MLLQAGPLISLRVSVSHLWRIRPAWGVLAGGGVLLWGGEGVLRLAAAVVLAEAVWGVAWALTAQCMASPKCVASPGNDGQRPDSNSTAWAMPYARPDAPMVRAARLLTRDMASGASWDALLGGLALAGILAWFLGGPALLLTLLALALILTAWLTVQSGRQPALCQALLSVGWAWALGMAVARSSSVDLSLRELGGSLLLALVFTLLQWGVGRARASEGSRARGIWLGQAAVLAALTALRLPWAAGVVAALFLPPSWWLAQAGVGRTVGSDHLVLRDVALTRSAAWWWAALVVAIVALA